MKRAQQEDALVRNTRDLGPKVRVIDTRDDIPEDEKNRVMSEQEAHHLRVESELDLFLVNGDIDPPVVKLMDYGKFKYEQSKRDREKRKKQRENNREAKEFYFTPKIEQHDYETKLNQIRKALEKGHDVKIGVKAVRIVRLNLPRGMSLVRAAREPDFILRQVISDLGDEIQPTELSIGDRIVTAPIRSAA